MSTFSLQLHDKDDGVPLYDESFDSLEDALRGAVNLLDELLQEHGAHARIDIPIGERPLLSLTRVRLGERDMFLDIEEMD